MRSEWKQVERAEEALSPATGAVELPLIPQHRYFLRCFHPVTNCTSRVMAVDIDARIGIDEIARAVNELVQRFEALRTRFAHSHGVWRALLYPPLSFDRVEVHEPVAANPAEHELACNLVSAQLWYAIQANDDWLFRVAVCRSAANVQTVVFAVHSLAADLSSVGPLMEAFQRALRLRQDPAEVATAVSSYRDYCMTAGKLSTAYGDHAALDVLAGLRLDPSRLRLNTFASIREAALLLVPSEEVPRLLVAARRLRTPLPRLLIAIATLAAMRWLGTSSLNVQLTHHGRVIWDERAGLDVDVGAEVGPFAAVIVAPIALSREDSSAERALGATMDALQGALDRWHEHAHIEINTGNVDVNGYRPMGVALNYIYTPPVPAELQLRNVPVAAMRTFSGALRGMILSISLQHAADIRVVLRYSEALYSPSDIDSFKSHFATAYAGAVSSD